MSLSDFLKLPTLPVVKWRMAYYQNRAKLDDAALAQITEIPERRIRQLQRSPNLPDLEEAVAISDAITRAIFKERAYSTDDEQYRVTLDDLWGTKEERKTIRGVQRRKPNSATVFLKKAKKSSFIKFEPGEK